MIFSRNRRGSGRHARDDEPGNSGRRASSGPADEVEAAPDGEPAAVRRGPYDVSEAPRGVERLDLGSLQIPAIGGVEVRVQADPDGEVQQVILVDGPSALQLGVFAAPRSEGIWDEVRAEIRTSLLDDGVTAEEVDGDYGVELYARMRTPEGVTDIRFVGIDGPRWMVRGVYQGPAAADPSAVGTLSECLAGLVVDRGTEAKPVREPLPLRLPREVAERAEREAAHAAEPAAGAAVDAPTNGAGPQDAPPQRRGPRRRA